MPRAPLPHAIAAARRGCGRHQPRPALPAWLSRASLSAPPPRHLSLGLQAFLLVAFMPLLTLKFWRNATDRFALGTQVRASCPALHRARPTPPPCSPVRQLQAPRMHPALLHPATAPSNWCARARAAVLVPAPAAPGAGCVLGAPGPPWACPVLFTLQFMPLDLADRAPRAEVPALAYVPPPLQER